MMRYETEDFIAILALMVLSMIFGMAIANHAKPSTTTSESTPAQQTPR